MNELSEQVIGACIEVHRNLGPGLLESAYEVCLAHELTLRGIPFHRQVPVPVRYKNVCLEAGYRLDLLVDGRLILELKATKIPGNILKAQLLTYLKLMDLTLALGVNFNQEPLVDGVTRVLNGYPDLS